MPRILISEPNKTPQPYKINLDLEQINIGRGTVNDLILTDGSTSTKHCIIRRVAGGYILEDNGSTNGVKLGNQQFKKIDINQDAEFQLGDVKVEITFTDEEYDVLAEEEDLKSEQALALPQGVKTTVEEESSSKPQLSRKDANTAVSASPVTARSTPVAQQKFVVKSGSSSAKTFAVFVLCILGFITGLSLKHFQETKGRFLISDIFGDKAELPQEKDQ